MNKYFKLFNDNIFFNICCECELTHETFMIFLDSIFDMGFKIIPISIGDFLESFDEFNSLWIDEHTWTDALICTTLPEVIFN